MTIEEYLRGLVYYEIPDATLRSILYKRNVADGEDVSALTERDMDLCLAEVYMWCASTPSSRNNTEDADGNWKHIEGGWQTSAYDKRQMRSMALDLFKKWGESLTSGSKIVPMNL